MFSEQLKWLSNWQWYKNKVHQRFCTLVFPFVLLVSVGIAFLSENKENWARNLFVRLLDFWCGNLHNDCTQIHLKTTPNSFKFKFKIFGYLYTFITPDTSLVVLCLLMEIERKIFFWVFIEKNVFFCHSHFSCWIINKPNSIKLSVHCCCSSFMHAWQSIMVFIILKMIWLSWYHSQFCSKSTCSDKVFFLKLTTNPFLSMF